MNNHSDFIQELRSFSAANVFNPYSDICAEIDQRDADQIRLRNLNKIIRSLSGKEVDAIWVGRDLGYRGGRRTGLAFTDEANLHSANKVWNVELQQATTGELCKERTAANIWNFVQRINQPIFMWNIFPFHPHAPGKPFSNRSHTARERDWGLQIFESLLAVIKPRRLVAIGNDAYQGSCRIFDADRVSKVRHPSYGGDKEFAAQLRALYGL